MQVPEIKYADAEGVSIAYQSFGEGERTVVGIPGFAQNIDLVWDEPSARRFFTRVSKICRVVHFDKRGTGLSDRSLTQPNLEDRVTDVLAVMDAENIERAVISGFSEGGTLALYFAAAFPERTEALLLAGTAATYVRTEDHPWLRTREELLEGYHRAQTVWGQGVLTSELFAPSMQNDAAFRDWAARYERQSVSPAMIPLYAEYVLNLDVRHLLKSIQAPTLVIHAEGDRTCPFPCGRYVAEHIADAQFVPLATEDHAIWFGAQDEYLDAISRFLVGTSAQVEIDRVLATVLFCDVVDSTRRASDMGDDAWRSVIDRHDQVVRQTVQSWRGRYIKGTGDGAVATFDGPSRAVRAASEIIDRVRSETGLETRIGLHCGEIECRGDDISGIAVHCAARVQERAAAGSIMVSRTVKDLVAGTDLRFDDRGEHALKGMDEALRLFEVVRS